jgi:hypothetical protein
MTRRLWIAFGGILVAAFLAPAAIAKGPIEAYLDGPGLGAPIRFGEWDEEAPLAPDVIQLAQAAGFSPAAFGQTPDPLLRHRPKGELGPRYVVSYLMPGRDDEEGRIVQDLYPYAKPNPVTYMAPGQPFFGTEATRGGWYVATSPLAPPLRDLLVQAGLPQDPPVAEDGSAFLWTIVASLASLAGVVALCTVALVRLRRPRGSRFSVTALRRAR